MVLTLAGALVVAALLVGGNSGDAGASCAAPQVSVPEGTRLRPGKVVTIRGRYFLADCYDTPVHQGDPPPMRHVVLKLKQRGHTWRLGTADARKHPLGRISWRVRIPRAAHPGSARLVTRGDPAGTRVRIQPRKHHKTPTRPPHAAPVALPATGP